MKYKNFLFIISVALTAFNLQAQEASFGSFTDARDGKTYKTVLIGTQTWMAENLAYKAGTGCLAYNNIESNVKIYGYLYNWEVANKVCPSGWHLPSEKEWLVLTEFLGGDSAAHDKMKEVGTKHWQEPDTFVNNNSGFTALPAGIYDSKFSNTKILFKYIGTYTYWWSSTTLAGENNYLNAYFRNMGDYYKNEKPDYATKARGSSVRCIKD